MIYICQFFENVLKALKDYTNQRVLLTVGIITTRLLGENDTIIKQIKSKPSLLSGVTKLRIE